MEQSIQAVAANLKHLREERTLSLDQLSELTGVSKSMLRQIETGKSSPTIATLWKIANGLRTSFTSLLKKPEVEASVKSFFREKPLTAESEHYRVFPLIPFDPGQPHETFYIEIDPGTVFDGEPHRGMVYEHVFVFTGVLEMEVNGKLFVIHEKEFLRFQADCIHRYRCIGDRTASAILQISYCT
jgi:transcriptional regulator with XRE-family HTH domain